MSKEIVYADLKFHGSERKENLKEFDRCEPKGTQESKARGLQVQNLLALQTPTVPPHSQHKKVLILTLLCLLLFIGLGALGGMFFTTLKRDMVKLNKLEDTKEELHGNLSLQLMHYINCSEKVRNLSITLQKIATELCRKLYQKEPEHRCKPCPKKSVWYKDSCYFRLDEFQTWERGEMLCSAQNASLLTVKNKSALEFVKSERSPNYWLGLSPRKQSMDFEKVDENIFSAAWSTRSTGDFNRMYCGHISGMYVSYVCCTQEKPVLCEKAAGEVKIKSVMSEIPEGSV